MILVPVMFPGSPTLCSLDPAYWTPTDPQNTFSITTLKFYIGFCRASHESLLSCTFLDSRGHTFVVNIIDKNNLDYINRQVVKKYKTYPTYPYHLFSPSIMSMILGINSQFIQQRSGHSSHQCILQMENLGYT